MIQARVERGTRAMLDLRRARLAAGERPLGWKVGFGAPAALAKLGTDRPLVGFLTDAGRLDDGAAVSLAGWRNPMLEAEIAVVVGQGLAPAIELADLHPPPEDPEQILAGNIYHRHFLVGPVSEASGITARLLRDGDEIASTGTPSALTGELADVVRATAELLEACGERLRPGDIVITGSVFPPLAVRPGERYEAQLPPLGSVTVSLT